MSERRDSDGAVNASRAPLSGTTLIVGPSGVGKTRLTARTLETWFDRNGIDGVVILEFGPSVMRGEELVGGRLDRFVDVPQNVRYDVLDAHAPRLEGTDPSETTALARENMERAGRVFDAMPPKPTAVFVDDTTIPFQHPASDPTRLLRYCERADCAVLNAYDGTELGTDDAVSRQERSVLQALDAWADNLIRME